MIDVAQIKIKAGNGGSGKVSFRREKYIPKGGPDGGDGGSGGCVYFVSNNNMATLIDFRSKPRYEGQHGQGGMKKKMSGSDGEDLYIKVPVGTLIYELKDNREILVCDMDVENKVFLAAKGGKGGKGNFRFRSSTNQTPYQYTPGAPGEEKLIKLEIKLVADVGLIGLPNAGKSTLINKLTNSNAKVADYPFTTLSPNLGVYRMKNGKDIVLSDIPGLIEGASEGKGLGDEFLRHVERTRILLHLIDPEASLKELKNLENDSEKDESFTGKLSKSIFKNYKVIREELTNYGGELDKKPEIAIVNKIDITEIKEIKKEILNEFIKNGIEVLFVSAVTGEGINELEEKLIKTLDKNPNRKVFESKETTKLYTPENLPNRKVVFGTETVLVKEKPNN